MQPNGSDQLRNQVSSGLPVQHAGSTYSEGVYDSASQVYLFWGLSKDPHNACMTQQCEMARDHYLPEMSVRLPDRAADRCTALYQDSTMPQRQTFDTIGLDKTVSSREKSRERRRAEQERGFISGADAGGNLPITGVILTVLILRLTGQDGRSQEGPAASGDRPAMPPPTSGSIEVTSEFQPGSEYVMC